MVDALPLCGTGNRVPGTGFREIDCWQRRVVVLFKGLLGLTDGFL